MNPTSRQSPDSVIRPDGKAAFDSIYDQPTPAAYFSVLQPLSYMTPGRAQPLVRRCVEALRRRRHLDTVTVLDLCSGYGINGALLKCRLTMQELYERHATPYARDAGAGRIPADALWYRQRRRGDAGVRVIAQDVAERALHYSRTVGLADAVIAANLEERDASATEAALMAKADLVVVTGGLSYIGERTFRRVLGVARRQPWALYFPLRHTDTEAIDVTFEGAGYTVETARRTIAHRRFRSAEERRTLSAHIRAQRAPGDPGPSPTHLEALIKLARPPNDLLMPPSDEITSATAGGSETHATSTAAG